MKGIKISTLTDANGRPMSMIVSPANVHDSRLYQPTMDGFRIKISQGRPITRPTIIVADAAYDSNEIRIYNRKRGIKSNIAINKRNKKKQKPGRPKKFDQEVYKKRSAVERFFSWIEGFRKIFPRYEVLEESYLGLARLSCILIIWRVLG
ncbi:MAG: IS5 family transposase [Methanobacterium sp.]